MVVTRARDNMGDNEPEDNYDFVPFQPLLNDFEPLDDIEDDDAEPVFHFQVPQQYGPPGGATWDWPQPAPAPLPPAPLYAGPIVARAPGDGPTHGGAKRRRSTTSKKSKKSRKSKHSRKTRKTKKTKKTKTYRK